MSNVMTLISQAIKSTPQPIFVHLVSISVLYVTMPLIAHHVQIQESMEMEVFVSVPIIHSMMIKHQDSANNVLIQIIVKLAKEKESVLIAISTIISNSIQFCKLANALLHLHCLIPPQLHP